MITLEQVIQLDEKIQIAVETITSLRSENASLKDKLNEYQKRIEELEVLISDFRNDQGEIEEGILNAIKQLDMVEGPVESEETATENDNEVTVESEENDVASASEPVTPPAPEPETDPVQQEDSPSESSGEDSQKTETPDSESEKPTSYEPEDDGGVELDIF